MSEYNESRQRLLELTIALRQLVNLVIWLILDGVVIRLSVLVANCYYSRAQPCSAKSDSDRERIT